ncbi:rifin PIR protein,putative [Plasmodium sp. DRC-Itaito]|nr:rifin PIR protein,putative [Plasmodium sp. DRC-Itaito]
MKVHYINILLFAHALNILAHNKNKDSITHHTQTNRTLCECELYSPANYDNDPQMKSVMDNFNKQTKQRFHEYEDRMVEKRKQCKDRCDKEIQKIILKDKLEKELMDKFATLDTDIQSDAIPTCICEKSIADKVEKECLRCGGVLGGGVAPGWGLISGLGYAAWLNVATAAATKYATQEGIKAGIAKVIAQIENSFEPMLSNVQWSKLITGSNYSTVDGLVKAVTKAIDWCKNAGTSDAKIRMASQSLSHAEGTFGQYIAAAKDITESTTAKVLEAKLGKVATQGTQLSGTIGYAVLAIVIIILIMVIIYLILRYRRKKKMKKKLQYIKLLEE